MAKETGSNNPTKEYKYFVHEPEGDGFTYFLSEKERDDFAKTLIQDYLQDGWGDGVDSIVTGILTHTTEQTNVRHRKDQVFDEEGCDGEGVWWDDDWDYICGYELINLDKQEERAL